MAGWHVLHVDDDLRSLEMRASILEDDFGYAVTVASNANEALDLLEDGEFDCVLSDYKMPDMDGIELLRIIKEQYPNLPFILFTGVESEEVAEHAFEAGATDYIPKSLSNISYELLAERIDQAIQQREMVEQLEQLVSTPGSKGPNTTDDASAEIPLETLFHTPVSSTNGDGVGDDVDPVPPQGHRDLLGVLREAFEAEPSELRFLSSHDSVKAIEPVSTEPPDISESQQTAEPETTDTEEENELLSFLYAALGESDKDQPADSVAQAESCRSAPEDETADLLQLLLEPETDEKPERTDSSEPDIFESVLETPTDLDATSSEPSPLGETRLDHDDPDIGDELLSILTDVDREAYGDVLPSAEEYRSETFTEEEVQRTGIETAISDRSDGANGVESEGGPDAGVVMEPIGDDESMSDSAADSRSLDTSPASEAQNDRTDEPVVGESGRADLDTDEASRNEYEAPFDGDDNKPEGITSDWQNVIAEESKSTEQDEQRTDPERAQDPIPAFGITDQITDHVADATEGPPETEAVEGGDAEAELQAETVTPGSISDIDDLSREQLITLVGRLADDFSAAGTTEVAEAAAEQLDEKASTEPSGDAPSAPSEETEAAESPPTSDSSGQEESIDWSDGNEYERPADLDVRPGNSYLVQCQSQDARRHAACTDLLNTDALAGGNVILVRYRQIDDERLEELAIAANDMKIIAVGYQQPIPSVLDDDIDVIQINNPNDLTRLGIVITGVLDNWDDSSDKTMVCFDPLNILLQYKPVRNVFRFLHVLLGRLRAADAISHFHIDPTAGDPQEVSVLKPLFDDVVSIDYLGAQLE